MDQNFDKAQTLVNNQFPPNLTWEFSYDVILTWGYVKENSTLEKFSHWVQEFAIPHILKTLQKKQK